MPKPSTRPREAGQPNWANQTIWTGDNLEIMRGMNSASVDLIYLDPPFNSKANYAAPIGSKAAGAAFKDTWGLDDVNLAWHGEIKHEHSGLYALLNATREIHGDSMMSYLIYMAIRIMEMRRVLKATGSIYLHCDPYASHYLKLLMDAVFGVGNCQNEIAWRRTHTKNDVIQGATNWPRIHDVLLQYRASGEQQLFNQPYESLSAERIERHYRHIEEATGRRYRLDDLTAPGAGTRGHPQYEIMGVTRYWRYNKNKMAALIEAGRVVQTAPGRVPRCKRYLDESKGTAIGDVWGDIPPVNSQAMERTGYPTQKPLALLDRIIRASSDEGATILDPFCGCATACISAERLHRQWVGIDISPKAADLVVSRMREELGLFYGGAHRTDIPTRTDLGKVIRYNDERNKRLLYGEQGGYCNGCEHHFELRNFHVDHIISKAKGGTDHISNLQLLCAACNSLKGDRPHEYLLACLTDKGWIKRKKAA